MPAGVLQNISGIVQSATGSITNTNKLGTPPNNNPLLKPDKSGFDVSSFTRPASCTETIPLFSANKQSCPESISVNFFENQVPDNSANISDSFVGNSQIQALETSESSQYSVPQTEISSEFSSIAFDSKKDEINLPKSHTSAQPITDIKTTVNFFHPESSTTPIRPTRPSSRKNITPLLSGQAPSPIPGESSFNTTPEIFFFPKSSTQTYSTTSSQQFINYFDPSQISSTITSASTPLEPPPRAGKASFRLQKGTKLYKNPFESQDTSPTSVTTILGQQFIPVLRPSTQSQDLLQQFIPHLQTPVSTFSQEHSSAIIQSVPLLSLSVEEPNHAQKVTNRANDKSLTSLRNHQGINDFNTLGAQGNLDKQYSTSKVVIIDNSHDSEIVQIGKLAIESVQPENKEKEKETSDKVGGDIGAASNAHSDECAVTSSLIQTVDLNQNNNLGLETPLTQLPKVCDTGLGNPYRRSPTTSKAKPSQPILANFFAPPTADDCSINSNFFASFPTIDAESNFNEPFSKGENSIDLTNFFFDPNALTFINSNITTKPEQSSNIDGSIETQKICKESGQSKAKSTDPSLLSAAAKEIFKSERNLISDDNKDKSTLKSSPSQIITSFNFSKPFELTNSEAFKPTSEISQSVPLLTSPPPTEHKVIPSFAEKKENISRNQGETSLDTNIPPPIAFENLITESVGQSTFSSLTDVFSTEIKPLKADQQKEVLPVNTFINYFNQPNQTKKEIDSTTFFDNFNQQKPTISVVPDRNEEQRLQNFFNNPPNETGDLNYNLIHSGLTNKDLIQRSTPTSILVEPPSSSCSEFSEFINNTAAFSKSKIYSEQLLKESKEKFHRKEATTIPVKDCRKIESVGAKNWEELPEEVLKELRMANLLSSSKGITTPNAHGVSTKYRKLFKSNTKWLQLVVQTSRQALVLQTECRW